MNPDEIEEERRVPMSAERCATPTTHYIEAEADIFGLNAAREPDGFATVSLKLGEYRKLSPGPLEEIILFDHPSGRSRILMAMTWKTEQPGSQ